ncbi:MAG: arsenate reductase (glutaredoxin) [Bacteroidota bacterium]|nr:arsenate reductase (glutaredoxin) [Bacteroidota bacterium]
MIYIYHNPRCSKSRQALSLLKEKGFEPVVIEYLKEIPTAKEFKTLLAKLNMKPEQLLRKGEKEYKEKLKNLNLSDEEWIHIMLENPVLIERPIVVKGNKGVVGRPIENVLELLE